MTEPTKTSDSRILDRIGTGHLGDDAGELPRMLVGWRAEALTSPIPDLVDVPTATAVIQAGQHRKPRRRSSGWYLVARQVQGVRDRLGW